MRIDSYSFGKMVVDGREYTGDLVLLPGRVVPRWWRESGHSLHLGDLEEVVACEPDLLVVGTGAFGRMSVPSQTVEALGIRGVEVAAEKTKRACLLFNDSFERGERVAGAFHLTC